MKKQIFFIFLFLLNLTRLLGQIENTSFSIAETLLKNERYAEALPYYQRLLKNDSTNANINFGIGLCYLNSRSKKLESIKYLEKALSPTYSYYINGKKMVSDTPTIVYKFLGPHHLVYDTKQAIETYEKFKKVVFDKTNQDLSLSEVMNLKIGINKLEEELRKLSNSPVSLEISVSKSGSKYSSIDYSFSFNPEKPELKFAYKIPVGEERKFKSIDQYFEIDTFSKKFEKINVGILSDVSYSKRKDTLNLNEAAIAASDDGQVVLTYRDNNGRSTLYFSKLNGNKWTPPEELSRAINTVGWEANECISADGNWLYFTSDKEGGFGGKDIYRCKKMPNGEWSLAHNLGPVINTPYNDQAPFIFPDGNTLYFSSNGVKPDNTFNIFSTSFTNSGVWARPVCIGYPTNGNEEESFVNISRGPAQTLAQGTIRKAVPVIESQNDNYTVVFKKEVDQMFILLKRRVLNVEGKVPDKLGVNIKDNDSEQVIAYYNSRPEIGKYSILLPPDRNNNITYQADDYVFQSENVNLSQKNVDKIEEKSIQMPLICKGSKIALNNIFFEPNGSALLASSNIELNNIFDLLVSNPGLTIEISDHIISERDIKLDKELAKGRALSIKEYLVAKGVDKKNIYLKGSAELKSKRVEVAGNIVELKLVKMNAANSRMIRR